MNNRTLQFYNYFQKLACKRGKERRKFSYYWNDITSYYQYFIHPDSRVLEIGCGTGDLLFKIKANYKIGIDFSEEMIKIANQKYPEIKFQVMSAEYISINEKFDVIILSNLVGYLANVQVVFQELKKLCHENTKILVNYYNYFWEPILNFGEWIGIKDSTPQQNWLTTQDLKNLFYLESFEVYKTTKRLLIPIYIPFISWFVNRFISKLPIINLLNLNFFLFAKSYPVKKEKENGNSYSVSVIIAARNESGNIENAILRLPKFGKYLEIIFIEGHSTDDTFSKIEYVAKKYNNTHYIKYAKQDGKGKADAVRKGFDMATGDILMILDADLTVPPEDLPLFYNSIASGKAEFVNGCRLVYPMEKNAMRFLNVLGNKFFSIIFTWLLDQSFKDTLCGTKVLLSKDYQKIKSNRTFFGDFDPFGDFDLIFGAHKLNLRIVELPVHYKERIYGETNISRFKHGVILLKMAWFAARKIKFF